MNTRGSDGPEGRVVEREITIDAPVAAVWHALTDARELERWFPIEAEVTPGAGGVMRLRWNGWYDDVSPVEVWEPERHLRFGFPAVEGTHLATDYWLEGRAGGTRLRVVSSGFGREADWDEAYEGVSRGWDFELYGLKHYLECHAGRDRAVAWAVQPFGLPHGEAWRRLTGPGGWMGASGLADSSSGDAYRAETRDGPVLEGTVVLWQPPRQFAGRVANLGDALFRIGLEADGGVTSAWVFLSTWRMPTAEVAAIGRAWGTSLAHVLDGERAVP